jgi:uncharacterized membrane protein YheB (UPF0754 family)
MILSWWTLLILFPLTCAVIGWFTNVIAVKMIFRPLRPVRVLGLPFQGVLPKHQAHFAREMGEVVTTDFITTGEMVQRIDAEALYQALRPMIHQSFDEVVEDLRERLDEPRRALLSDSVIESVRRQVEKEIEAEIPTFAEQVASQADELVNLTDLIAEKLVAIGPAKLEELIRRVAAKELKFIEYYGGVFGFFIGLLQFTLVTVFPIRYSLPVVGLLVGAVTNYLAIQMLFYPRQPWRLLLFKIQGLFPKRQEEIARELALIAADDFVVAREVFSLLSERMLPREAEVSVFDQYEAMLTARFPAIKSMLDSMLTPEQLDDFRSRLALKYTRLMPGIADALVEEAADQLDLKAILDHKIKSLSKLRFEGLIRGLFKQEELYLVIYGALLGGLMGAIQLGMLIVGRKA